MASVLTKSSTVSESSKPDSGILNYINSWWSSQTRANRIKSREYYNGIQDIRFKNRNFFDPVYDVPVNSAKLTNTILTCNLYKKIIDQRVGYALDRQMRVSPAMGDYEDDEVSDLDNFVEQEINDDMELENTNKSQESKFNELLKRINLLFGKEWKLKLRQALVDCLIDGEVFLYPYIEDGIFKTRFFKAQDSLAIYKDDTESEIEEFIRVFTVNTFDTDSSNSHSAFNAGVGKGKGYIEHYKTDGLVRYETSAISNHLNNLNLVNSQFIPYLSTKSPLTKPDLIEGLSEPEKPLSTWKMPILRIRYAGTATPLLSVCKEIVDQINFVYSNYVDLIRDNPDNAIIKLINYDGDQDDLIRVREEILVNRIVSLRNLPGAPEGNFEIVDMPIHNEDFEQLLKTLHSALFEVTGAFDDSGGDTDVLHGRIQSIGAQLSLIMMDQAANTLLRSVEIATEKLINEYYIPYLNQTSTEDYSDIQVSIDYSENTTQNTAELISTLVSLGLEVSNETLLNMVPFVPNVRTELQRIMNEQNLKLSLQTKLMEQEQDMAMESAEHAASLQPANPASSGKPSGSNGFSKPSKPSNPFQKSTPGTGSPNGGGKRVDVPKKTQADR